MRCWRCNDLPALNCPIFLTAILRPPIRTSTPGGCTPLRPACRRWSRIIGRAPPSSCSSPIASARRKRPTCRPRARPDIPCSPSKASRASSAGAECQRRSGSASSPTSPRSWPIPRSGCAWRASARCRARGRPMSSRPRSRTSAPRSRRSTRRPRSGRLSFGARAISVGDGRVGGNAMRPATHWMTAVVAALASLILLAPTAASAQGWPQRPVRFVIPFGPGAGADIGARLIQEKLTTRWGKPVVIENRPGGDSMIAIQTVLSANDDHTFLWGPAGNFTVHPYLYDKLPYNPDDIIPIARFSATILAVGVPTSMNFANLADFVKRAKAEPGKFNSAAVPGITEFAFDFFTKTAGLSFVKVPYRDIVQGANDLSEARLHIYVASYAIIRPHRDGGRVKALVVMGNKRAPSLPDLPTAAEEGFPSLEMEGLVGLFGSPAVPAELREKIGADIVAAADDKAVEDRLNATAQTPNRGGAKEFAEEIARQRAQIANIAKELGLKPSR